MKFALVNMLRDPSQLPAATLGDMAAVLMTQLFEHVAPFCDEAGAPVSVVSTLDLVPPDTVPVLVLDDAQQAEELGVHTFEQGMPRGYAFWGPLVANGGALTSGSLSLSATLSHEIIEILLDPYTGLWADRGDGTLLTAYEFADPVEDQSYAIAAPSGAKIMVSDFVSPRWFRQGPGPFNYGTRGAAGLIDLSAAFTITPGGYTIDESITITGAGANRASRVRRVNFGPAVPVWKQKLKLEKSRTRLRIAA